MPSWYDIVLDSFAAQNAQPPASGSNTTPAPAATGTGASSTDWVAPAITAATSIYGALSNKNAAGQVSQNVSNLQYQPIDLKALQEQARITAQQNAKASLALERETSPDLAESRSLSQKMVADDLKLGGQLPTDVANAVTSAGIATGNKAGLYGGAGPLTAANLGLTALSLRDSRLNKALQLSQANPLPVAGLDPGSLASAAIADQNARSNFDLSKTGAVNKSIQSTADANNALAGTLGTSAIQLYGATKKQK